MNCPCRGVIYNLDEMKAFKDYSDFIKDHPDLDDVEFADFLCDAEYDEMVCCDEYRNESCPYLEGEKELEDPHIFCPYCNNRLVFKGLKPLETLMEHVSDPNGDIPDKPAWGCPCEACPAHKNESVWTEEGEGPFHLKNGYLGKDLTIDGYWSAAGSIHRKFDVENHQHNAHGKLGLWDWRRK